MIIKIVKKSLKIVSNKCMINFLRIPQIIKNNIFVLTFKGNIFIQYVTIQIIYVKNYPLHIFNYYKILCTM